MSAGVADRSNVLHFWQCHEPIVSSFIATGTRFSSYSILRACTARANLAMHTGPIWIGWSARTQLASLVSAGGALLRQTPISGRIGHEAAHGYHEAAHGHKACGRRYLGRGWRSGRSTPWNLRCRAAPRQDGSPKFHLQHLYSFETVNGTARAAPLPTAGRAGGGVDSTFAAGLTAG